jgi:hypothetical protein
MKTNEDITCAIAISATGSVTYYVFLESFTDINEIIDLENAAVINAAQNRYRLFKVYSNYEGDKKFYISYN